MASTTFCDIPWYLKLHIYKIAHTHCLKTVLGELLFKFNKYNYITKDYETLYEYQKNKIKAIIRFTMKPFYAILIPAKLSYVKSDFDKLSLSYLKNLREVNSYKHG